MSTPRVFISYSHDSPEHSERVLKLAWALRSNGIAVELDQFHNEKIVDWPRWCNEQTSREHADFVVCVCTAEYRRRIEGKAAPEKGRGVHWEGSLLDDDLYDEKGNRRLIPVRFDDEPESSIPRFLRGWTQCVVRDFALADPGYDQLLRILTGKEKVEKNELGVIPDLETRRATLGAQAPPKLDFKESFAPILVLAIAVAGFFWVKEQYPTALWAAAVITALCLANVLWHTILLLRRRRREAALREWAIQPLPDFEADYFRVGPYSGSEADRKRYRRPDGADADILAWVRTAGDPILYLSGLSGAGKSSLLNASLLPALAIGDRNAAGDPPSHVIAIPEHGDPIALLREALLAPGAIWKDPRAHADAPIARLLADACRHLEKNGRRLFLLCDQFEVALIRSQGKDARLRAFARLLRIVARRRRKTFPGLTVLLSFRSDYDDLLKTLGLPRWVEGKNGRRVAPFSRLVARAFLADPRSGLQLAEGRLNEVLDEAEAVTGTPGLIRPIALNMLGKLLERHAGHDPGRVPRGALLAHDVRRAVEAESVRAHARPILRTLLSDGLRVRRTVAETAAATGLAPALVAGYHARLLDWPLVRCLEESEDPAHSRWEIAHDFIARLLAPILETPQRTLAERARPFITPALFLVMIALGAALLSRPDNVVAELSERYGVEVEIGEEVFAKAIVQESPITNLRVFYGPKDIQRVAELLASFNRPVTLRESGETWLREELSMLKELDLTGCTALKNVHGLKGLTSLQKLNLSHCAALQNVDGLKGLNSIQSLDLSDCVALQNVDVLKDLPALRELALAYTPIRDARLFAALEAKGVKIELDDWQKALREQSAAGPPAVPERAK